MLVKIYKIEYRSQFSHDSKNKTLDNFPSAPESPRFPNAPESPRFPSAPESPRFPSTSESPRIPVREPKQSAPFREPTLYNTEVYVSSVCILGTVSCCIVALASNIFATGKTAWEARTTHHRKHQI